MASRLRYVALTGAVGASGVTNVATSHTFAAPLTYLGGAVVPTLSGGDHFMVTVMNAAGTAVAEIWKVTAYNSGTGAATIVRAQEGSTAVVHASGSLVLMGSYPSDFLFASLNDVNAAGGLQGEFVYFDAVSGKWAKTVIDDSYIGTVAPNSQTGTSYTFVLADKHRIVNASNAAAQTYTIPLNAAVAFPIGSALQVYQAGAGQVTFAMPGGTLRIPRGAKIAVQYGLGSALKVGTDEWVVAGDVTT